MISIISCWCCPTQHCVLWSATNVGKSLKANIFDYKYSWWHSSMSHCGWRNSDISTSDHCLPPISFMICFLSRPLYMWKWFFFKRTWIYLPQLNSFRGLKISDGPRAGLHLEQFTSPSLRHIWRWTTIDTHTNIHI